MATEETSVQTTPTPQAAPTPKATPAAKAAAAPKAPAAKAAAPKTARPVLSKDQRSKIMKEAATRRWDKAKKQAAQAAREKAAASVKAKKKNAPPREFSSALKTAEKRLAKAILERAEAAAKYAVLSAEIPSLQRLVLALRNPLGMLPEYASAPAPSLEQIIGDQPLPYQNPPRRMEPPVMPVPQELHPANTQGRAGGGAVGVALDEEQNEDQFLDNSSVAGGGGWH